MRLIRFVGVTAFVAQAVVALVGLVAGVGGFDGLLSMWVVSPHILFGACGVVALYNASRWAPGAVAALGVGALGYVCYVYGPAALGASPEYGGWEFVTYPLVSWPLALCGVGLCYAAVALSATPPPTRRAV